MTKHLFTFWILLCATATAYSADLSDNEIKALLARATMVKDAFDRGDSETVIKMTHPSIYRLTNGKEAFEALTRQSFKQVATLGITILDSSLSPPSRIYNSGTDTVCFIPRTSVMTANGKKVRSIGFLIAVRGSDTSDWLFLDGSGLRKNPESLKTLLPGLPKDVALPENRKELIE